MIAFRFNVNAQVGYGHFVRCNAIAEALSLQGIKALAIVDQASTLPSEHKFKNVVVVDINNDIKQTVAFYQQYQVQCLLVDHYHCDKHYQAYLAQSNVCWGQYDYRCQGDYLGKFVININPAATPAWYQDCQFGPETQLCLGAQFATVKHLAKVQPNQKKAGNILLCVGAGNDKGVLAKLSECLTASEQVKQVHIVCPSQAQSASIIRGRQHNKEYLHLDQASINHIACNCQLAIITAGTLSFEASYLGLPFIVGHVAQNQEKLAQCWQAFASTTNIGDLTKLDQSKLLMLVNQLLSKPKQLSKQADKLTGLVDGNAPKRIAEILTLCH